MATRAPNPRDFKSWEDAFQYPIPVVRKLEQQLRGNINESSEKLRSLVGASYRDLLGTAERIIGMDDDMTQLDGVLRGIGQNCNARSIERKVANHGKMSRVRREGLAVRRGLASTLALLQACLKTVTRLLKSDNRPLLVAKLLVLARLLYNSASRTSESAPALANLQSRLGDLRRRLLDALDRQTSDAGLERPQFLEAMTAYALITSSSPMDCLKQFLLVRQQALEEAITSTNEDDTTQSLNLIFQTVDLAQAFFPKRLPEALSRLKSFALLQDPDIRAITELDLDIYERWIADDVRRFTPWPRHDDLSSSQAMQVLEPWTRSSCQSWITGLGGALQQAHDAREIARMRERLLRHLIESSQKIPSSSRLELVTGLRETFQQRLFDVIESKTRVGQHLVADALQQRQLNPSVQAGIWDAALDSLELRNGAGRFRRQVMNRSLGRDGRLQKLGSSLESWSRSVAEVRSIIKSMKDGRWDEDLDVDDEDGENASVLQQQLGRDDPDALTQRLDERIKDSFLASLQLLQDAASSTTDTEDAGQTTAYLLRICRELKRQQIYPSSNTDVKTAVMNLISSLHAALPQAVVAQSSTYRTTYPNSLIPFDRTPAITLWEGSPPQPVQPSPACLRSLHELQKAMQALGTDLWTAGATDTVKDVFGAVVVESVERLVIHVPVAKVNGGHSPERNQEDSSDSVPKDDGNDGENHDNVEDNNHDTEDGSKMNDSSNGKREIALQTFFDVLYLQHVLRPSRKRAEGNGLAGLDDVAQKLQQEVVGSDGLERLEKSSLDYYKRTYLLFGILVGS